MWAKAWDRVSGLLDQRWWWIPLGLLILAVGVLTVIELVKRADEHRVEVGAAVRERVQAFASALADGQGGTACGMLADDAAEQLAQRVGRSTAKSAGTARSCEEAVRVAATWRSGRQTEVLGRVEVLDVDYEEEWDDPVGGEALSVYEGATATAQLRSGEIELSTESSTDDAENWTIDSAEPVLDLMVPAR